MKGAKKGLKKSSKGFKDKVGARKSKKVTFSDEEDNCSDKGFSDNEYDPKEGSMNGNDLDVGDYDILGDEFLAEAEEMDNSNPANNLALVESIKEISATKRRPTKRKEASQNAEEFFAVKKRVNMGEGGVTKFLESVKEAGEAKTVDKVKKLVSVAENSKSTKQSGIKTLEAPAERIVSDKAKRTVLYENAKEEVSRWNAAVYHNRVAEQLVFPLNEDKKAFKKPKEKSEFMPVTPLEEEIAKVLYGEDYVKRKKAEMAKPEHTDIETYMLSVEEAMATHSEMAKLRALQSYAMAKAKRQNKIKSKKYHRLLRKSKIKNQMKEFEELQTKDPEAAMLKLEELNRARVSERMTLKHRNTSKWAKMQSARAKYNKDSRMALADQLKISKDLTQKVQESSDEDEEDMELPQLVKSAAENPWMLKPSLRENDKLQMYYTGYKKFWDEYNKQLEKKGHKNKDENSESSESDNDDTEKEVSKSSKKTTTKNKNLSLKTIDANPDVSEITINDEELNTESMEQEYVDKSRPKMGRRKLKTISTEISLGKNKTIKEDSLEVNPDNFLKIKKSKASIVPQFSGENSKISEFIDESESSSDEKDQRDLIAEAFEDDDVVDEFRKQKLDIVDASRPSEIDNFLPGWGSWTGKNIVENPRKRKKFVKKTKKPGPRKDDKASHVIINEDKVNDKVRSHQVKEVPFPFSRVKDFEKTVRAPIGRTWMPEHSVKSLTAPKVITRLGATIKPISEDVLVKPKQKFHVPNTIVRLAKVTKGGK